tara:strand:- start:211 stop:450 length:240 start_codon:yes stop_codon:yes gene_type:complete
MRTIKGISYQVETGKSLKEFKENARLVSGFEKFRIMVMDKTIDNLNKSYVEKYGAINSYEKLVNFMAALATLWLIPITE